MNKFSLTGMVTTPSIANVLAGLLGENLRLQHLITVGETIPPALTQRLQQVFGCIPHALYAASEAVIGVATQPGTAEYFWNKSEVFLEVLCDDGTVRQQGEGEILVTLRRRKAQQVIRLALNDRILLRNDSFCFLCRTGHAFTLASGVKISRSMVNNFMNALSIHVAQAEILIEHREDGKDTISIDMHVEKAAFKTMQKSLKSEALHIWHTISPEIADLMASGLLQVQVKIKPWAGGVLRKRQTTFREIPWEL